MYPCAVTKQVEPVDQVDQILVQWAAARPDLDTSAMGVIGRISRLSVLLIKQQARIFAEYGLDFASFDVLATLRRSGPPHELTPSHLAKCMIVTPGAVAQRLTRLETGGLITRSHSTTDRRVITVALTQRGQDLVDTVLPAHVANEQRMLAQFSPSERKVFASMLRRMLIDQDDLPAQTD